MAKNTSARLADFQYAGAARAKPAAQPARRGRFDLRRFDPAAKPFSLGDKARDKAAVEALAEELDKLQDMLYADRRFKVLVVLQGTDTSGKDGTIRSVFALTSALGVRAVGWKAPNEEERAHDYLWRIHQQVPKAGEIVIFNRSHYEDVLVPVVRGWITKAELQQRFAHINDFERMLCETGTIGPQVLPPHLEGGAAAAAAGAARRSDQALEVRGRRPRRAQALGRVPGGLQRDDRRDRHVVGALDGGAGRLEDAPQSHDRHRGDRGPARPEAALSAGRPGARQHQGSLSGRESRAMTELSADYKALAAYRPHHKVRFVTAASLFDGHDAAINIMRRILQGMGAEVIHLGHNRSVDEIVTAALQEDVQGIAISSYQGGHVEYFKYMVDLLKERGGADIRVFGGGGGVIVPSEIAELQGYGVERIYSPEDGQRMGLAGNDRRDDDALRLRSRSEAPTSLAAIRGPDEAARRALARLITALESGAATAPLRDELRAAAALTKTPGRRHHRHRRRRQVEPHGRADPALAPRPGRPAADRGDLDRPFAAQERRRAARRPHPHERDRALERRRPRLHALAGDARSAARSRRRCPTCSPPCKAAGFDLVIVETSGIGQGDAAIVPLVDVSLYVMTPEFGAASQLEKIDMLDFAEFVAINKFDRKGAADALRDVAKQVQRNRAAFGQPPEQMPVFGTVASRFNDDGVNALYQAMVPRLAELGLALKPARCRRSRRATARTRCRSCPASRARYLAEIAERVREVQARGDRSARASRARSSSCARAAAC